MAASFVVTSFEAASFGVASFGVASFMAGAASFVAKQQLKVIRKLKVEF